MLNKEEIIKDIKIQMLKSEDSLKSYATKSIEAVRLKEENSDIRLEYARDIDRIIHSPSYTRYIDKTQVYSYVSNDNISRRMTHVQFVSRAAKTIARGLGLNEDLCESIALGHDVGHVPFGHFGESILNEISKKRMGKCFAHNLNSVRVYKDIEKKGIGCNLTLQTLDGIMCHNGELVQKEYRPVKKNIDIFLTNGEKDISIKLEKVLRDATTDRYDFKILEYKDLAFDHAKVLLSGIERLRNKVNYTDIVFNMMHEYFTLGDVP